MTPVITRTARNGEVTGTMRSEYATQSLDDYRTQSDQFKERNDCTVKALMIAGDVDYPTAHAAMKANGRPDRRGPPAKYATLPNGTRYISCPAIEKSCADLGIGFRVVPRQEWRCKTMTTAPRDARLQKGRFIAYVRGHVAPIIDGEVIDHTEGRRNRIKEIYELTPAAQNTPAPMRPIDQNPVQHELF